MHLPDRAAADAVSRILLEKRLVACANIVEGGSMYWWQGKIEQADEVFVLYKTTRARFADVEAAIVAAHPYDVPCIIAYDHAAGHQPYWDWIEKETG